MKLYQQYSSNITWNVRSSDIPSTSDEMSVRLEISRTQLEYLKCSKNVRLMNEECLAFYLNFLFKNSYMKASLW